jgi:hypothetical protein
MMGLLLGYGFLAGATLGFPDDPDRRGFRSWLSRQAVDFRGSSTRHRAGVA